ncbi:MAG: nucleoside hydrolase [Ilumatobacter sp.]|nr:nucleoside hydrolase [Ilumatobacter sp.]
MILDTDFASDVDDVGALAVLHALADAGEVEIVAVMVSDGGDAPSHRAIDAVNTFYGRPDLPIGVVGGAAPQFPSTYATELASAFPNDIEDPPAAVDLYRELLAAEPDASLTIVSVGYLTNLDALLSSPPDEHSSMSGAQLVAAKVRRWVAMGGYYPDSADHPFDAEFNFAEDVTATLNAVAKWPTPAVFSGFEIGDVVLTGAVLQGQTSPENPVREAYRLFNGGEVHRSWDLTAVLAAVRGTADAFEVCTGRNLIGRGGSNRWQHGAGPHGYLRLVVPADDVATALDGLLIAPPGQ